MVVVTRRVEDFLTDIRNEVIFGKSLHPLLAHVTQPLVPQLTDSVGCYVHFLQAYLGMH